MQRSRKGQGAGLDHTLLTNGRIAGRVCLTSVITFTAESGHRRGSGRPIGSITLGFGVTFTPDQAFTETPVHGNLGQKTDVATDRPPDQMTNLVRGEETLMHLIR